MSSDRLAHHQTISNTIATNGSQAFAGTAYGNVHYGNSKPSNTAFALAKG
jgi:hypothetical protein